MSKERCIYQVHYGNWGHTAQCKNLGHNHYDGYCHAHYPPAVDERQRKRIAAWDKKRAAQSAPAKRIVALESGLRFLYAEWQRVRGTKFTVIDELLK